MIQIGNKEVNSIFIGGKEVQTIIIGGKTAYEKYVDETDYFYIQNTYSGSNTVTLTTTQSGSPTSGTYATSVQYSKDKRNWTPLTLTAGGTNTITLNQGEKVYFRNDSGKWNYYSSDSEKLFKTVFTASQIHTTGGNINTLLDYTNLNSVSLSTGCFFDLFHSDGNLTDASNLTLPATTVVASSYRCMFYNCTSLTSAPALPATTFGGWYCYQEMFNGCSSLTTAPTLPAATLTKGCYYSMFNGCTSLNTITTYATDISASECTSDWLYNVAATGTFYNYGPANYSGNSPDGVPTGWTARYISFNITSTAGQNGSISPVGSVSVHKGASQTFTVTPSTNYEVDTLTVDGSTATLTNNTYTFTNVQSDHTISVTFKQQQQQIDYFYIQNTGSTSGNVTLNCGVTSDDGALPPCADTVEYSTDGVNWTLETLIDYDEETGEPYGESISISLSPNQKVYFRNSGGNWSGYMENIVEEYDEETGETIEVTYTDAVENTFGGVNSTFTVGGNVKTLLDYTNLNITIEEYSFNMLFNGFTTLTDASNLTLPDITLAKSCYQSMFGGCTSLTSAPTLPATTLAESCYQFMFSDCTSLTTAPTLPATTLASSCYGYMFSTCTSLNEVTTYADNISAAYCIDYWLSNVSNSGAIYNLGSATYTTGSTSGIPTGWTEYHEKVTNMLFTKASTDNFYVDCDILPSDTVWDTCEINLYTERGDYTYTFTYSDVNNGHFHSSDTFNFREMYFPYEAEVVMYNNGTEVYRQTIPADMVS